MREFTQHIGRSQITKMFVTRTYIWPGNERRLICGAPSGEWNFGDMLQKCNFVIFPL